MGKIVQKKGILGDKVIIYFEDEDRDGKYTHMHGEWIWIQGEQ